MSRRRAAKKREILPDAKYGQVLITKFINTLMTRGKKSVAEKIVYMALENASKKAKMLPLELLNAVLDNVKPHIEVRSRRVGGATYQVPVDVRSTRALALAFRWLIQMSRKRSEKTMIEKLAAEMLDALNNKGLSVKKREDTHKMAEANKAFAHYRW